jgi:cyanophycinase-like exopeptidase
MGPIGLHGGGEFLPGDERFLDALLVLAERIAERRRLDAIAATDVAGDVLEVTVTRTVILPVAAARGRPEKSARDGIDAFGRRAEALGRSIEVEASFVHDAASADDSANAELILSADLVYLPGGDPDLVPGLLDGSASGRALVEAHGRGALIAGASAGAMGLADWSWTPQGGIPGLGLVHGLVVVPHYDDIRRTSWQTSLDRVAPRQFGYLGLDERTGVISGPDGWEVAGEGAAYWFEAGSTVPVVARHGERLDLPG